MLLFFVSSIGNKKTKTKTMMNIGWAGEAPSAREPAAGRIVARRKFNFLAPDNFRPEPEPVLMGPG